MSDVVNHFRSVAQRSSVAAALATFYAYESQVPRIAAEKRKGLCEHYGADATTIRYFAVHETADVHHSQEWKRMLDAVLAETPELRAAALDAAEEAAAVLWHALDGIERERQRRKAS